MNKRIILVLTLIIISQIKNLSSSPNYYVSPGLRIGWLFGNGMTLTFKISLGVNLDTHLDDNFHYWNITFGYKERLLRQDKKDNFNHRFFRIESGLKPKYENALLAGAGVGISIFRKNGTLKPVLMTTIDYGALIFASVDMYHSFDTIIQPDLGILAVFPIPLTRTHLGFN